MTQAKDWFEDLQRNLSDLIARSPAADLERNVKAMMGQAFSRMDLVTREELDVQAQLLQRALTRIAALEARLDVQQASSAPAAAPAAPETPPEPPAP